MIALVATALAGPCADGPLPTGPLTATLLPGDLGRARSACLRTEVGLGGGAALVVDTADFYGRIQGMATVDARIEVPDRPFTVDVGLEPVRLDSVVAPIPVSTLGLGAGWLGGTWQYDSSDTTAWALSGRVILPTASGSQNARPLGGDLGLMVQRQLSEKADLHGGVMLYGQRMLGRGPALGRTALSGLVGAAWHPSERFALVLDLPVSAAWDAPIDYVALVPGVRGALGPVGLELGIMAPLVGGDRTLVAADLRTSMRF